MIARNCILKYTKFAMLALAALGVSSFCVSKYVHYKYPSFNVEGVSMMPAILPKSIQKTERLSSPPNRYDVVIVDSTLVDSTFVTHPDGVYIKRIAGIPGDKLLFRKNDGALISINGSEVKFKKSQSHRSYSMTSKDESTKGATFRAYPYSFYVSGHSHNVYLANQTAFASSDNKKKNYLNVFFNFPWLKNNAEVIDDNYMVTIPDGFYFALSDNMVAGTDSRHFGLVSAESVTHKVN